jgi:hypothetical protein
LLYVLVSRTIRVRRNLCTLRCSLARAWQSPRKLLPVRFRVGYAYRNQGVVRRAVPFGLTTAEKSLDGGRWTEVYVLLLCESSPVRQVYAHVASNRERKPSSCSRSLRPRNHKRRSNACCAVSPDRPCDWQRLRHAQQTMRVQSILYFVYREPVRIHSDYTRMGVVERTDHERQVCSVASEDEQEGWSAEEEGAGRR